MRSVRKVEPFIEIIFYEDRGGFFSEAEARAYADELSGFADEILRLADTLIKG